MRLPRRLSPSPLLGVCALLGLCGARLCAQAVFDVSGIESANISASDRWIVLSGSATSPSTGDSITIVGTNNFSELAYVAMSTDRTIANLVYGTADGEKNITRSIIFRGSGSDNARSLTLSGNLTKYDTGTLSFRNNNSSMLRLTVQGDVNLQDGILHFGTNTHDGLSYLNIGGTTSITGGTLNLRVGSDASLGALAMSGGTLNLNTSSGVNAASGRTISVRNLSGTGGTISEDASTTGTGITLTLAVTGTDTGTHAYGGTITDGTGLDRIAVKMSGAHTQVLSGANTYAGGTVVESGALLIANAEGSGVGSGAVTVKSGARFGGDGIVALGENNGVTVESGGILAAGGGAAPLRFDGGGTTGVALTMNAGAEFAFDLGGSAPSLVEFTNYAGAADFSLNGNVLNFTGVESEGVYTLFRFYSDDGSTLAESGIVAGLVLGSGLENFEASFLTYAANEITLTVTANAIPEPATAAVLLGFTGLAFACGRRRR